MFIGSVRVQVLSFISSINKNVSSYDEQPITRLERLVIMTRKTTSPYRRTGTYVPLYHADTVNHCPACGGTHWHIGRASAECAFCDAAIPLAAVSMQPARPMFWSKNSRALATA